MSKKEEVSLSVIRRLPRYYRFLGELLSYGMIRISSRELSEKMNITASQIRQDLNCFGGFGQQGYGYNIKELHEEISKILGLDNKIKTVLIGAGNLGKAVANHMDFSNRGFDLIGIFDKNDKIVGKKIKDIQVLHTDNIKDFCNDYKPKVAILCIPKIATEEISNILIASGVKGFWNFSHYDLLGINSDIVVENVHMSDSLMTLSYLVKDIDI